MIKRIAFTLACLFLPTTGSAASAERFGVGLAFGDPGGITFIYRNTEKSFFQAYLGSGLLLGSDYDFVFTDLISSQKNVIPFLGFGGFIFTGDHWSRSRDATGFGLRMPVGLLIEIPEAPFHFHLEVAPAMTISPFMYSFASAMIGVRFLF